MAKDKYLTVVYEVSNWDDFAPHMQELKEMVLNDETPAKVILISSCDEDAAKVLDDG